MKNDLELTLLSLVSFGCSVSSPGCACCENTHHPPCGCDVLKTVGQSTQVSWWAWVWLGGGGKKESALGVSRVVDGIFFYLPGIWQGPFGVRVRKGCRREINVDMCIATGHSTEKLKGWTVLFLGPVGFLPAASVWGAVSPPVSPSKQGYPSLLSPGWPGHLSSWTRCIRGWKGGH